VSHYFDLFLELAQACLAEASPSCRSGWGPPRTFVIMSTPPPLSIAHFLSFRPFQHPKSIELLNWSG